MQMQLNDGRLPDGTPLLSSATLWETWTPQIPMSAGSYAFGWMVLDYNGQRMITHAGNTEGYTSEFSFLPDADLGVLVLSNRSGNNNFGSAVRDYVFELAFGLKHTADAGYAEAENSVRLFARSITAEFEPQPMDAAAAARFTGEYERSVTIRYNETTRRLTLVTEYLEVPLTPGNEDGLFYLEVSTPGILLQSNETGDSGMEIVVFSPVLELLGEVSPPLTVRRVS